MPEYRIHKVITGNHVHLSFEFFPPHEQLSGFLICDSSLMSGKEFERYETVITLAGMPMILNCSRKR